MPFYCRPEYLQKVASYLGRNKHNIGDWSTEGYLTLAAQMFGYNDHEEYARASRELKVSLPYEGRYPAHFAARLFGYQMYALEMAGLMPETAEQCIEVLRAYGGPWRRNVYPYPKPLPAHLGSVSARVRMTSAKA